MPWQRAENPACGCGEDTYPGRMPCVKDTVAGCSLLGSGRRTQRQLWAAAAAALPGPTHPAGAHDAQRSGSGGSGGSTDTPIMHEDAVAGSCASSSVGPAGGAGACAQHTLLEPGCGLQEGPRGLSAPVMPGCYSGRQQQQQQQQQCRRAACSSPTRSSSSPTPNSLAREVRDCHGAAAAACAPGVTSQGCARAPLPTAKRRARGMAGEGAGAGGPAWRSCCGSGGTSGRSGVMGTLLLRLLLLPLLLVLWGAGRPAAASDLTGTDFPFENCKQDQRNSPYYATLYSYRENLDRQTSTMCIQIRTLDTCIPGKWRCCNTSINKVKFFPKLGCRGSVASALVNGNSIMSYYWEEHQGLDILKITPLAQWLSSPAKSDGAIVCLNLKAPCWTAQSFSYNDVLLEYALYDKKVNNYECCPVGTIVLPGGSLEPNFPSRPPPGRGPPMPPGLPPPDFPDAPPPRSRPPPPKARRSPPPLPPKAPKPPPATPNAPPSPPPPRPPPRFQRPPPRPPPSPPPGRKRPPPPPVLSPPPPSPPPPPPPTGRRSPPPPPPTTTQNRRSPPPPPSPPPPAVVDQTCSFTAAIRRTAAANQGFSQSVCPLFGALIMLPLYDGSDSGSDPTFTCAISTPSYMVLTASDVPAASMQALFAAYGDGAQVDNAVILLGLGACTTDSALLKTDCPGVAVSTRVLTCGDPNGALTSPPPPPPPVRRSPPPSPSPPPPVRRRSPPPPPPPPDDVATPKILVFQDSAYLIFYTPTDWNSGQSTCQGLGGNLAAIDSKDEYNFLADAMLEDLAPEGFINLWFGLTVTTAGGAAIPGYNADGSRMSYTPVNFQYDRTRAAVRYYFMTCDAATRVCSWNYSPGGASDLQPGYICEFMTAALAG